MFELETAGSSSGDPTQVSCTHGPDPAPAGVDVRQPFEPSQNEPGPAMAALESPPCFGTGSDGFRVQVLFMRAADVADRYQAVEPTLFTVLRQMDANLNASAGETGGSQHIRFLTDASCNPTITQVIVSPTGDDTFANTVSELRSMGFNRADRKYFIFADSTVYCGMGHKYSDDSENSAPGANWNNGHPRAIGMMARIDSGCWIVTGGLHELAHTLGAVQRSAPHATAEGHCTDDWDAVCYPDADDVQVQVVCQDPNHERMLDCNHDDYYSTNPPPGSYLATHWNTSNSAFLSPAIQTAIATVVGAAFYIDGTSVGTGPSGSRVSLFATGAEPGFSYKLVSGRADAGGRPCAADVVPVNDTVRFANAQGVIGQTAGTLTRPPGQWQICFLAEGQVVTGAATYTVSA